MIRSLLVIRDPSIDMNMFHLHSVFLAQSLAYVEMVELLGILFIEICISLRRWGIDDVV